MAVGFVLIRNKSGLELDTYKKLSSIDEISELYQIFGEYDFIAKILADDFNTIGNIVIHKIRIIEGVLETKTITGMDLFLSK
jgi:DNA-binding Lrp family transcriptional regulator